MSAPELDHRSHPNGNQQLPGRLSAASKRRIAALALASGVIGAAVVTAVLYATGVAGDQTKVTSVATTLPAPKGASGPGGLDTTAIFTAADPGVVDITATGVSSNSSGFPFSPPQQSETIATGTGFEIDSKGDILTADHVVAGASSITAKLADGTVRRARVLGTDRSTDVAVLEIDASGLTLHPLPLGDSGSLSVGSPLAVIGDPFGYDRSLSTGVVSALKRTIQAPDGFTIADTVQTDAAINPGNSGGPLVDAQGQVIGIADQIATGNSGADSFTGVGFAVPINDVKGELTRLEHGAHVSHAYLGVAIGQTGGGQTGAEIASVQAGGPAAKAGLRTGDIVTAVDGKTIHGANGLVAGTGAHRPGHKLTLTRPEGPG
jgi:putative serine protease PepD